MKGSPSRVVHQRQQQQQQHQALSSWLRWVPAPPAAATAAAAAAAAPDAPSGPCSDLSDTLSLAAIRRQLILMEDTIIFALIERAAYALNAPVYAAGGAGGVPLPPRAPGAPPPSLLEWLLRETERVHGAIRRYTSPDENAYFPADLPPLVLPRMTYPAVLAPAAAAAVNVNAKILGAYVQHLLPQLARPGDDANYGSAAMHDVVVLQALSRRVHYGKFVAEAKFRAQPEQYSALIRARDGAGIMALLTDRAVELKVLERVRLKAATFGQDLSAGAPPGGGAAAAGNGGDAEYRVRPEAVAQLYEQWVMPLTKEVEVEYLLRRLDE